MKLTREQVTAIHEAGHAVVAWAEGVRVKRAEIGAQGGRVDIGRPRHRHLNSVAVYCRIMLAGRQAEMLFGHHEKRRRGYKLDIWAVKRALAAFRYTEDQGTALVVQCVAEVDKILSRHLWVVNRVAEALWRRKLLGEKALLKLLY